MGWNESSSAGAEIADELIVALEERHSPLAADPEIAEQVRAQARVVLRRAQERLGRSDGDGASLAGPVVGRRRAQQSVHPADSLGAAALLFEAGLPLLLRSGADPSAAALALNAAIMEQVVPASVAYVDVLLERLAVAHREERLGISRELHDRVAHGIAAGMQRVQLSRHDPASAAPRLEEALRLLEVALDETRSLAVDLRHSVGDKHLDEAISDYVLDLAGSPSVVANTVGAPRMLTAAVQEEAFIVVREAIHNARRHSSADRVDVTSTWLPGRVTVVVADDGVGFERDDIRPGALGLIAAQERAELIGAELAIASEPGVGTTVTLAIADRGGA